MPEIFIACCLVGLVWSACASWRIARKLMRAGGHAYLAEVFASHKKYLEAVNRLGVAATMVCLATLAYVYFILGTSVQAQAVNKICALSTVSVLSFWGLALWAVDSTLRERIGQLGLPNFEPIKKQWRNWQCLGSLSIVGVLCGAIALLRCGIIK
jgi:hypothetical protein